MPTCKTETCADKGTQHSAPEVGTLVCGLCGQEMTLDE